VWTKKRIVQVQQVVPHKHVTAHKQFLKGRTWESHLRKVPFYGFKLIFRTTTVCHSKGNRRESDLSLGSQVTKIC
jgi:hypothetical protein